MSKKIVSCMMLTLFLTVALMFGFVVYPVKASGTVYIRATGNVDPPTAPILNVGNAVYILTGDINDYVVVERSNIVVDGTGHTIQGTGSGNGITIAGNNVTIKNMEIKTFARGVYLSGAHDNLIIGNNIAENARGIYFIGEGNHNIISGNNITANTWGIALYDTGSHNMKYNVISRNNITANAYHGIEIWETGSTTICGNIIKANGYSGVWFLHGSRGLTISENIITENYEEGITTETFETAWFERTKISGNIITNNRGGIYFQTFGASNDFDMSENTVSFNREFGIDLRIVETPNVIIAGNNITANNGNGLSVLPYSRYTTTSFPLNATIKENTVKANNGTGITVYCASNNTIYHNNILDNINQFNITTSSNTWNSSYPSGGNYWSDYTGTDADGDGIGDTPYIIDVNNTDHHPLMGPLNKFAVGTISGTPYEVDIVSNSSITNFSYDAANRRLTFDVTGESGTAGFSRVTIPKNLMWCDDLNEWIITVGGTLTVRTIIESGDYTYIYFIYTHSMKTVKIHSTHATSVEVHDIAVINVEPSKTVVGEGQTFYVNVTVANQGDHTETFQITTHANALFIQALQTTLNAGEQKTLTLGGIAAGKNNDYVISAVVIPMQYETDTADNSFMDGTFKVTIPGDINGDFFVNIVDATQIGLYWQQPVPPAPPNVDINGDGVINIQDATQVGLNWQQHA